MGKRQKFAKIPKFVKTLVNRAKKTAYRLVPLRLYFRKSARVKWDRHKNEHRKSFSHKISCLVPRSKEIFSLLKLGNVRMGVNSTLSICSSFPLSSKSLKSIIANKKLFQNRQFLRNI